MAVTPTTHLEKSIAGTVEPATHLEKVISEYGGGGGGGAVSSVNGKTGAVVLNAEDVGGVQDSLKLTATPTAGPSDTTLMSGTWSGATWEEVVAAVLASRLIRVDVAGVGPITLLYNLNSETIIDSNNFSYYVSGVPYVCIVSLKANNSFEVIFAANPYEKTVTTSGTVRTFTPAANTIYQCGELDSLTISNPPATGAYSIVFTSGSTATATTIPATILGLEDFAAEANTIYEINVQDNRAVVGSWAVSA